MTKTICCFLPYAAPEQIKPTVETLKKEALVKDIFLLTLDPAAPAVEGCSNIVVDALNSSATMKKIAEKANADIILLYSTYTNPVPGYLALARMNR